jgi:hypothetical protein
VIRPAGSTTNTSGSPAYVDTLGEFARLYGVSDGVTAFVVRPDGYIGARLCPPTAAHLTAHLARTFAPADSGTR